uniref:hypothetical protein n=1 Tax=Enterocloster aldenensis TaxID=358742 RepID=UPI00140963F2
MFAVVLVLDILSAGKAEEKSGAGPPLTDGNAADGGNECSGTPGLSARIYRYTEKGRKT